MVTMSAFSMSRTHGRQFILLYAIIIILLLRNGHCLHQFLVRNIPGDLVQHRNFLTLEWRHDLKRVSRDFPTVGSLFQFLNFGSFDYYLNLRTEYDGVWDYGPNSMRRMMRGTRLHQPYFDDARV